MGECRRILIIFDIDGTIVDSFRLGYTTTNDILAERGFELSSESQYHEGTKWTTRERLARTIGLLPEHEDFHTMGIELEKRFETLMMRNLSVETVPLFSGIESVIRHMQDANFQLGALSNSAQSYVRSVLGSESILCGHTHMS